MPRAVSASPHHRQVDPASPEQGFHARGYHVRMPLVSGFAAQITHFMQFHGRDQQQAERPMRPGTTKVRDSTASCKPSKHGRSAWRGCALVRRGPLDGGASVRPPTPPHASAAPGLAIQPGAVARRLSRRGQSRQKHGRRYVQSGRAAMPCQLRLRRLARLSMRR